MPITPSERVAAAIREAIHAGAVAPGQRLPAERDLARDYDVSPVTVRRAIAQLRADGVIETRTGRGTYVRLRPAPTRLEGSAGATQRSSPTATIEAAPERIAEALGIESDTHIAVTRWTEAVGGDPIAIATQYATDAQSHSSPGASWNVADLVRARLPTPEEATTLNIAAITPVLAITRTAQTGDGLRLVVDRVFAADRVELMYHDHTGQEAGPLSRLPDLR